MSTLTTYYKLLTKDEIIAYQKEQEKKGHHYNLDNIIKGNKNKYKLINEQCNNKGLFIHYEDTTKRKSSFVLNDYSCNNCIIINNMDEFKKIVSNRDLITKYNYTEELLINQSRLFMDIDIEDVKQYSNEIINHSFEAVTKIMTELCDEETDEFNIKVYGVIEVKNDKYKTEYNINSLPQENIIICTNSNHKKDISAHLSFNVYSEREDIKSYMTYIINSLNVPTNIIDSSVYSTTRQCLRCSFSAKVNPNDKSVRIIPKEELDILTKDDKNIEILYNTRMSPTKDDKYVDLKPYYENYQFNNSKLINTPINQQINKPNIKHDSIFQYIKYEDKIINIKDIYAFTNHFEFGKHMLQFSQIVLTPEETINEIKNIDLPDDIPGFINKDEWLDKVINDIKNKVKQDITNIKPLYVAKKYINKYYEQRAKEIKKLKKEDDTYDVQEMNKQLYKELKPHLSNIDYYIQKYEKLNFVSRDYYDFYKSKESKTDKLLYNCYKNCYGQIFNAFDDSVSNNITQFRLKYKLDQNTANKIYEQLVVFENMKEYRRFRTEYIISVMSKEDLQTYKSNLEEFLNIFKDSFVSKEDYNYYLSYYSAKLQTNKSLNKGIINQGTEKDPAINSFKTFFNELLDNYVTIKSANVNNINKTLNGTYFTGDLLIIEELPKKIKDVDNLINTFREYSSKKTLTIEEKGEKPREILNRCDYIINTNHTVKCMFKDFNDAKGLLKRFRIITRKTIIMTEKINKLIDEIVEHNDIYQYLLKEYLINEKRRDYFDEHRNEYNDIMHLYEDSSSTKSTMNKKSTTDTCEDFIKDFTSNYIDNKGRLKLNKFRDKLIKDKVINIEHAKTLKQNLIILLSEDKTINKEKQALINVSSDNKQITILNKEEAIKIIYDAYYEYDDEVLDDDDTTKK